MKKLLIYGVSSNVGGIETFILNFINENKNKPVFEIILLVDESDIKIREDERFKNYKIIFIKIRKLLFNKNELNKIIETHKINYIWLNLASLKPLIYFIFSLEKHKEKFIIHGHNSGFRKFKITNIMHYILRRKLMKINLFKWACSHEVGHWMFNKEFTIINNFIDYDKFEFNNNHRLEIRRKLSLNSDDILIGNVGRNSLEKNQGFLLELMNNLRSNYKLCIIGDGPMRQGLERTIEKYNLNNRIILIDKTFNIEKFYSAFDIFLLPSLKEGFPISLIEAQVSGLPCFIHDNIYELEYDIGDCLTVIDTWDLELWVNSVKKNQSNSRNNLQLNENYNSRIAFSNIVHKLR